VIDVFLSNLKQKRFIQM